MVYVVVEVGVFVVGYWVFGYDLVFGFCLSWVEELCLGFGVVMIVVGYGEFFVEGFYLYIDEGLYVFSEGWWDM